MVEVKANIDDSGINDEARERVKTDVESALRVAGIQAEVKLCSINLTGQLIITSDDHAENIQRIVGTCPGIKEAFVDNPDDPRIDLQAIIETPPGEE